MKFFLAVGKADEYKLTSKMKYSYRKVLKNKVSAHSEVVAMCYAHRNTIFTQNSKIGVILILALTWTSGRSADFRSLKNASAASTDWVYNIKTHWLCVGTFRDRKKCVRFLSAILKFLDFENKHLGSYFPTWGLSLRHVPATSEVIFAQTPTDVRAWRILVRNIIWAHLELVTV